MQSNLALARDEEPSRPLVWLVVEGSPPVPLVAPPLNIQKFNRPSDQTERLLADARALAARKAARSVGGGLGQGGKARGCDSDLQARWDEASAENGGAGPEHWHAPAARLGITQERACAIYGRSAQQIHRAFRTQQGDVHGIGKRDAWDVWFTTKAEADRRFGRDDSLSTDEQLRARKNAEALARKLGLSE